MRKPKVDAETVGQGLFDAFRRDGFAGVSLRELGVATGLNAASLYHRFPQGKTDMAIAALNHAAEQITPLVIDPLYASGPAAARLAASARGVATLYGDGRQACILAVLALSDAPDMVVARVRALFGDWQRALAATLAEAGAPKADALAEDRIAQLQGALVLAQAGAGDAAFARAVERLGAPA